MPPAERSSSGSIPSSAGQRLVQGQQPGGRGGRRLPRLVQAGQLPDVGVVEREQGAGGDAHRPRVPARRPPPPPPPAAAPPGTLVGALARRARGLGQADGRCEQRRWTRDDGAPRGHGAHLAGVDAVVAGAGAAARRARRTSC